MPKIGRRLAFVLPPPRPSPRVPQGEQMATIDTQTRQKMRVHDEIAELEQSVVDDSIAAYSAMRDHLEAREKRPGTAREVQRKHELYNRAWEASVAALLVKRAVLVFLEGDGDDDYIG